MIMAGDRGMITGTRIDDLRKLEGTDWITSLRAAADVTVRCARLR
jgi:hypothetical protein